MYTSKILLIENNVSLLEPTLQSLSDIYSCVETANSIESLNEKIRDAIFDVIIYNTNVDESGGFNVLAAIRAVSHDAAIIAYSDTSDVNNVVELLKNGVFDFLTLPFDISNLLVSVKKAVENRQSFIEISNLNTTLLENQNTLECEKEALRKKNQKLEAITSITKAMTGTLDLDEILHEIISGIYNVFQFDRIIVSLVDHDCNLEEAKVAMGIDDSVYDNIIKALRWDINDTTANPWMDQLIREKSAVRIDDPLSDEVYKECEIVKFHSHTFVKVPLIAKDNVVGTLTFDNAISNKAITGDEISTLSVFADHAGIAIEKAVLYKNLSTTHEQLKEIQQKMIESEKLMVMGEVAASVNHEINNPLCSISLNIEMLKKHAAAEDEFFTKKLDMILVDIDRIRDITKQLAAVKKIVTKEYSSEVTMLDISESGLNKNEKE
ncbi:GAF domain-containing protein [Thermodesulfobacteriota bacterium]